MLLLVCQCCYSISVVVTLSVLLLVCQCCYSVSVVVSLSVLLVYHRDVNLPLFGGIPLFFFFTFRFFKNDFPLFFIKSPTKKKKKKKKPVSDTATVGRVQRAVVNSLGFCSLSKFERTVSLLGTRSLTPTAMLRVM